MRSALLIIACLQTAFVPSESDRIWTEAEALFEQGKNRMEDRSQAAPLFRQAAEKYAELERRGIRHPCLFRNLGDASFLADRLPEAILAYRRGLEFDPGDVSLRERLELARAQVFDADVGRRAPETDSWPAVLPWPGFPALLATVVLAWTAGCVALAAAHRFRSKRLVGVAAVLIALAAGAGVVWKQRIDRCDAADLVVVREDGIALRRGNGPHFPPHPEGKVLRRGMEACRLHERGGWLFIRLASGEAGWVAEDAVATAAP